MISLEPSTALYSIVPFPYACSLLSFNRLIVLSSSSKNWYLPPSFSSLSLVFISLQSRVVHFPYSFGDIRSPVHPFPFFLCHSCLAFLILSSSHESCIVSCSRQPDICGGHFFLSLVLPILFTCGLWLLPKLSCFAVSFTLPRGGRFGCLH